MIGKKFVDLYKMEKIFKYHHIEYLSNTSQILYQMLAVGKQGSYSSVPGFLFVFFLWIGQISHVDHLSGNVSQLVQFL